MSELQAGVSADLVAFLSADIDIYSPQEGNAPTSRADRSGELRCVLNPSYYNTAYSSRSIQLLSKVRVVLISAHPPTLDNDGVGRPLPPSCYKNVLVVHWVSSRCSTFCIDSKPLNHSTNKGHAASCMLESSIASACLDKISPTLSSKLNLINTRIIDHTLELYIAESTASSAVLEWSKEHGSRTTRRAQELSEYITHPAVDLSFLDNDQCCRALVSARSKRSYMSKAVFNAMKLERDSLAYTKVFFDACWMSAELIRFCDMFIPAGALPPYALNAVTVVTKCVKPFMHNSRSKNFVRMIPPSFHELYRTVLGIRRVQAKYRPGAGDSGSWPTVPDLKSQLPSVATGKATGRRVSSRKSRVRKSLHVQNKAPSMCGLNFAAFVHIGMAERNSLMADLNVIIRPFHKKLLSNVYNYIVSIVQPGHEWMVKLCLVLCTWAQASPLPADELRALMLLNDRRSVGRTLFSITHASPPPKSTLKKSAEDMAGISEAATFRKQRGYNSRAMSIIAIAPRVETFWVQESSRDSRKEDTSRSSMQVLNTPSLLLQSWQGRGAGPLDGQWINRRSQRWRVGYVTSGQEVKRNKRGKVEAAPFHSWDPTFCDTENSTLVAKSLIFAPKPRSFDSFMEEWMKLTGMRTRHDFSTRGLAAQGMGESRFAATVMLKVRMSRQQQNPHDAGRKVKKNDSVSSSSRIRRAFGSRGIRRQSTQVTSLFPAPTTIEEASAINDAASISGNSDDEKPIEERGGFRNFSSTFKEAARASVKVQPRHTQFVGRPSSASSQSGAISQNRGNNFYDETKGIYSLLVTESAVNLFKLLENHSALSGVFRGMTQGVSQYMDAFMQWKALLDGLCYRNIADATDAELVHLTAELIPPQLEVASTTDETRGEVTIGLWASGKELSIVQTMLLVSVVAPDACEYVAEVYFALCNSYLRKNNVILKHKDEYWVGDENSSGSEDSEEEGEEEYSDEDEWSDDEAQFDTILEEEDEEGEEEDEGEEEEEDKYDDEEVEEEDGAGWQQGGDERFQDGIFELNCWTKLKRITGGTDTGRQVRLSKQHLPGRVCYRDFQNWEEVLQEVLLQPLIVDKINLVKQLRFSFEGVGPLYLATDNALKQMATMSHYAANYASGVTTANAHLTIINCRRDFMRGPSAEGIDGLLQCVDTLKRKKERVSALMVSSTLSSSDAAWRPAVAIEMVDLSSGEGNSVLDAAIKRVPYDVYVPVEVVAPSNTTRPMSTLASAGGNEVVTKRTFLPAVVISVEWDYLNLRKEKSTTTSHGWGCGPMLHLSLLNSHWLPRYTLADVIGCSDGPGERLHGAAQQLISSSVLVSRIMSEGMLREDLETSVLFVMRVMRRVARTRLSKDIQERIRYSSKVEISSTVCCILIWRMTLMVQAKLRESDDIPGGWSTCLESLSLWQIARLVLKISDLLDMQEVEAVLKAKFPDVKSKRLEEVAASIRQSPVFSRAIHLLAESFCRVSFKGDRMDISKAMSNVYEGQPVSARTARSRLSVLMRSGDGAENFMSHYKATRDNVSKMGVVVRASSPVRSAESPKRPAPPADPTLHRPTRPVKEKPSVVRKRKREQALLQKVEAAQSTNYMSFDSLSSLSLHALGPNRRHFVSDEFRERLCATLAHYMSGVISMRLTHNGYSQTSKSNGGGGRMTAATGESATPMGTPSRTMFTRRQPDIKDFGERWPRLCPERCDMTIGTLSSTEVMNVLVAWTHRDALNSQDASPRLSTPFVVGLERRKSKLVFNRVRRSLLLRAGDVMKSKKENVR